MWGNVSFMRRSNYFNMLDYKARRKAMNVTGIQYMLITNQFLGTLYTGSPRSTMWFYWLKLKQ